MKSHVKQQEDDETGVIDETVLNMVDDYSSSSKINTIIEQ